MFLRSNLRLKIGLIIVKVSSNYINDGTWLAAMVTGSSPVRPSTIDCPCANYVDSHQFPPAQGSVLRNAREASTSRMAIEYSLRVCMQWHLNQVHRIRS